MKRPKGKGNRFERDVVNTLRERGWPHARRNFASGGYGGGDIVDGPTDCTIECKAVERLNLWAAFDQAKAASRPTDTPIVVFKRNRSETLAALPFEDLLDLLALREAAEQREAA